MKIYRVVFEAYVVADNLDDAYERGIDMAVNEKLSEVKDATEILIDEKMVSLLSRIKNLTLADVQGLNPKLTHWECEHVRTLIECEVVGSGGE